MNLQLRSIRKKKGLRQEDLAAAIGTTARVIGAWERQETALSLDDACTLADYFDCTLDELAGREWRETYSDRRQDDINRAFSSMDDRARGDLHRIALSLDTSERASNAEAV